MTYDWRVQVIAYGERDGWTSKRVDTPYFELRSNAQFGGIWDQDGAAITAARCFEKLLQDGDEVAVAVTAVDGSIPTKFYQYTLRDASLEAVK